MQTDYYEYFTILHRKINMGSSATNFTGAYMQHLLSTVKFVDFISLRIRGQKMNKNSKLLNKINFTESYTRDMVPKILPEPRYELNMFQKNYQALSLQDKLFMHLTIHGLAY